MARSNTYDLLPYSTNVLRDKLNMRDNTADTFMKSDSSTPNFKNTCNTLMSSCLETNEYAIKVYNQFKALREDFQNKVISPSQYKEWLKPLYVLLTNTEDKISILGFDTKSIATELKRAGY